VQVSRKEPHEAVSVKEKQISNGVQEEDDGEDDDDKNMDDKDEAEDEGELDRRETDFVQCESCHKWRRVPLDTIDELPDQWYCYMNPNQKYNSCSVDQEMPDWEIDKELELEAIYIKQQIFDPNKPPREPDIWIHQEEKNSIQNEFDKLYDSLFSGTTTTSLSKKEMLPEQMLIQNKVEI